ncbi:MAG: alcohol dehydrogenase catalytic domain-containing protein [Anaerolineae bacterium]|nr:alcohol dehydrogenase catalytic domain-containing protein [Anaerolineae bacterium]
MRAVYFRGQGVVEMVDEPKPQPKEGELLIRVAANGVCGSDRKILRSGFNLIPGHEVAGTVVEAGAGCQTKIGARIAAYIPVHCGECPYCQKGAGNLCPNKKGLLGWSTNGGYAEYMIVPDRNALLLDDRLSFHEGVVLLDTIGTSCHGLRLSRCWEVQSALVIGAGPIGIGAVAGLKAFGVPHIYVSEISPWRRQRAEALGAIGIDPTSEDVGERLRADHPYGAEIVFEGVGTEATIWQSFDLVAPGGAINLVGEHWGHIELERPKGSWMINDIRAIRSFYFTIPEFYENQEMVLEGKLDAASLATHSFPLEQTREAYDLFAKGESFKIMVEP